MDVQNEPVQPDLKSIYELLRRIEARVQRLEDYLGFRQSRSNLGKVSNGLEQQIEAVDSKGSKAELALEFKIGEYWLAQLGTVVLLLGMAFFISYPFKVFPPAVTSLLGYLAVIGIFGLSRYWQKNYQYLSRILFGGGLVLLYFATLRLHFFSANPLIPSKAFGLTAVVVALALIVYFAVARQSAILSGMGLFLCYATSLISDTTHFSLIFITLTSVATVYIFIHHNWQAVALISMILAYLTHLLWLLNNPLLGKPLQAVVESHGNIIYLTLCAGIFASANLFKKESPFSDFYEFLFTSINSIGYFVIGSLVALTFFKSQLSTMNLLIASVFIVVAISNWARHQSKYASAIYACFGYMALSIAIFSHFKSPDYFIWLCWQSLLVISTAIWFRSRIIVLVNILIYLGIFLAYLGLARSNDFVNLSYAMVALTSARVLNWKKERLELKTDMIRNVYLASAFVIVLYGLYQAVPGNYVSISWLAAALFYFAMSLALKNIKYRWLAILTIFATILHIIFIDMAIVGAEFRILLFLAVGIVLLAVSLLYSRHRKKLSQN